MTGQTTILVVDDEDGIRDLIRTVLEPTGAQLLLAGSAEEAAAAAADAHIDLLLTDVTLPGASGTELATTLRTRQPALKVIYMTGWQEHVSLDDVPDALILNKPFELIELARFVAAALGREG
jgi:DNA-binding NtrC family response regulator